MSAPVLWIFLPFILAGLLLFIRDRKFNVVVASIFSLILTIAAWLLPIDTALSIGNFSFKLTSSFEILGRHLILVSNDRSLLALIYGSAIFWFIASLAVNAPRYLIPLGLAIISILVAALAVEPFLYAALLIEMAVLLSIPLLSSSGKIPGKGLIRFLIFQTLAMPFILFSGWLLAGIEANPGDLVMVQQAAILITLGFSFLLAVFPFYSWIPLLAEEASPFIVGFILWIFPTATIFFGMGFLDRYTWLRDAAPLGNILTTAGVLMIATAGVLSAFQRQLGRIMGYAMIMGTGFSLLAASIGIHSGFNVFFMLFIPRVLCLLVWAFSLSILKTNYPALLLDDMKGLAHTWPYIVSGLVIANLAVAGLPLLAVFPAYQVIWESLATISLSATIWVLIGCLGLLISALRTIFVFATVPEKTSWGSRETVFQRLLIAFGFLVIFIIGLFPQWTLFLWSKLPVLFTHLGR